MSNFVAFKDLAVGEMFLLGGDGNRGSEVVTRQKTGPTTYLKRYIGSPGPGNVWQAERSMDRYAGYLPGFVPGFGRRRIPVVGVKSEVLRIVSEEN
jgi:hypothetical protein